VIPKTPKSWRVYESALLAFFVLLGVWQLFIPPSLGVSDTSDSAKLIGRYCLTAAPPEQNRFFDYFTFRFVRDPRACWNSEMPTSAHLPLLAAFLLSRGSIHPQQFDVRFVGAVYLLLLAVGFLSFQRSLRESPPAARFSVPIAALLIFDNATYIPWLSTFYFDTAALVFFLLSVVAMLRVVRGASIHLGEYIIATCCLLLFAASKVQHSVLVLAAIPGLWCSFGRAVFPSRVTRLVSITTLVGCCGWMFLTTPSGYRTTNLYNALFFRALPFSENVAADLAEFGMGAEYVARVGQHAFVPDSPLNNPQNEAYLSQRLTYPKIARYYLTHPRVTWYTTLQALDEGSRIKVRMTIGATEYRLGNYPRAARYAAQAQSGFLDVWTGIKTLVFAGRPRVYLAYALALLAALWFVSRRRFGQTRSAEALLVSTSFIALLVVAPLLVLSDGVDTGRHLFLFNAILDVSLCVLLGMVFSRSARAKL
jgi:hypothetical protein